MSTRRSRFPTAMAGEPSGTPIAPVMLDGMEVLVHETVGLYPVTVRDDGTPTEPAPARNGRHGAG